MAETFVFELVSPERLLVSRPVRMVTVPGSEGQFGVLVDHAPMINTLAPGLLDIENEDGGREVLFVSGGFAEVTPERCTVLAEEAVAPADIDRNAVESELAACREDAAEASGPEQERLQARARVLEAKLAAASPAAG